MSAWVLVPTDLYGPPTATVDRGGTHIRHVDRSHAGQRDLQSQPGRIGPGRFDSPSHPTHEAACLHHRPVDVIRGTFDGRHRYALDLRPSLDAETIERSPFSVIKSLCTGRRPVDHQGTVVVGASGRSAELGDP